jgi:hypothetical protein
MCDTTIIYVNVRISSTISVPLPIKYNFSDKIELPHLIRFILISNTSIRIRLLNGKPIHS